MQLDYPITISTDDRNLLAQIVGCEFGIRPTLFGHRLTFVFLVSSKKYGTQQAPSILDLESDVSFVDGQQRLLIGRLSSFLKKVPYKLDGRDVRIKKHLDLPYNDLILLADKSYRSNVIFEFQITPQFLDDPT